MPTLTETAPVAGALITKTQEDTRIAQRAAVINGNIDRTNLLTGWVRYPITRSFYKLTASLTAYAIDIPIPVYNDTTNIRYVAVGWTMGRLSGGTMGADLTQARTLKVQRYDLGTGVTYDTLQTVNIAANAHRGVIDATVVALVPGTYGFRLLYEAAAGTFDAEEWANFDLWVAVQVAALAEL